MASIYVNFSDYLDEVSTKELERELEGRDDRNATTSEGWRDWQRLADFIASGATVDALELLASLSPYELCEPRTTICLLSARRAA
jgi:hypothetical protein